MLVRLSIDFEHPSNAWWDNGGRALWDAIREGFEEGQVVLDESLAASWMAEAAKIPGWSDGPEHAPHPILARPVEDDEIV